jgi:hypothetical protein
LPSFLGVFWPLVFAALYGPDPGLPWLILLWLTVAGWLLLHRVARVIRRMRGYRGHSRYWGDSVFQQLLGFRTPRRAHTLEVVGTVVLAVFLLGVSKPLGRSCSSGRSQGQRVFICRNL